MSTGSKTKIGLIKFINCLPLNYTLERQRPGNTKLIYGTPVELNSLINRGVIDVAPISSFEYLQNKHKYTLIKKAGISSDGECGSVLLFSKKPFGKLNGAKISVPCDSASSVAMLKIILNEHDINLKDICFKEHNYSQSIGQFLESAFDAVLFIGDNALKNNFTDNKPYLTFDIGTLWKNLTGLPAVFGTWAARTKWTENNRDSYEQVNNLIPKAIETGLGVYFNEILNNAYDRTGIEKTMIRDYLTKKIDYSYTSEHQQSLELFEKLYKKLKTPVNFTL